MNKKILIFIILAILLIATIVSVCIIINNNSKAKLNRFYTEKIIVTYTNYTTDENKTLEITDKASLKEILKMCNTIDINSKPDENLSIRNDYTVNFNNGTIIYMQKEENIYGYLKLEESSVQIYLPTSFLEYITNIMK